MYIGKIQCRTEVCVNVCAECSAESGALTGAVSMHQMNSDVSGMDLYIGVLFGSDKRRLVVLPSQLQLIYDDKELKTGEIRRRSPVFLGA
jgi:hypothetical protein